MKRRTTAESPTDDRRKNRALNSARSEVSPPSQGDQWLREVDRRTAALARRWPPETWRYFAALVLERDATWFGAQDLTKEAVFALTLRVQQWLALSPELSKTSLVVRALQTLRREVTGKRFEVYEVLDVLRHAREEDEPSGPLLFVRANLRHMFGKRGGHVPDEMITRALVFDRAGRLDPQAKWEAVFELLKELGIMSAHPDSVRRGWRQVLVARGIRSPQPPSRRKLPPDR
jgi:hypothetical protein